MVRCVKRCFLRRKLSPCFAVELRHVARRKKLHLISTQCENTDSFFTSGPSTLWRNPVQFLPHGICFLQPNCFLKCSCSPFAFPTRERIAAYCSCHHVYRIFFYICCPFTLIALQICLTSPKGLPLVLCRVQGIAITARKACLVRAHVKRKSPEDPADTPHKEVAFLQQHSQWKREGEPPHLLRRLFRECGIWVRAVVLIFLPNLI